MPGVPFACLNPSCFQICWQLPYQLPDGKTLINRENYNPFLLSMEGRGPRFQTKNNLTMELHLNSYGARLRVKDGLLQVTYAREGKVQKEAFSAQQVRRIFLQKGTSVSIDAVLLAMEYDISLLVTDHFGFPVGRFCSHEPSSTSQIQKAQALVSCRPAGLEYARGWIAEKLRQQHGFMEKLLQHQPAAQKERWAPRLQRHQALREKLLVSPPSAATFRGIEGSAGRIFYLMIGQSLPERYRFVRRGLRPAQDPFNAFLNYAYAILYSRVEEALLTAGLNPYLGFMHRDGYRFKSMVYDFIEPFRVTTIACVYRLFSRKKISQIHYRAGPDKSIRITTEGKQRLVARLKKEYEEKRKPRDGLRLTEEQYIRRRASGLAQSLLRETGGIAIKVKAMA